MSSKDKPMRITPEAKTIVHKTQPLGDILHILEKESTISAWVRVKESRDPELFVVLADELSDSERNALAEVADVVVDAPDSLTRRIAELEEKNRHLRCLGLTDDLTGLYNYRFFAKQLQIEMARTKRTGHPCCLMMVDLDDFKVLNDTLGHDEGNKFLVKVGRVIREKLRPMDILCRFGGDEFAVIMPATGVFDAVRIAQRLRKSVSKIPCKLEKQFSASVGLAEYDPTSGHEVSEFVNMADRVLYKAKRSGKNGVCFGGTSQVQEGEMLELMSVTQKERQVLLTKDRAKVPGDDENKV